MKAFSYSPPKQYIQDVILEPGTYTFGAKAVFAYGYDLTVGVKTASGNWIAIPYEIKEAGGWNKDISKTFTITERCVQFNLMYSGTLYNCNILSPWLKKGSTSTLPSPNTEDLLESLQDSSYTVLLSNENHTFAGSETTALAGSTETQILIYKGTERIFPTSITVNTADLPTGMSRTISLETSRVTFNVTTSMTSPSGTIPITFMVNGRSMTILFSYSISFKGGKGEDAAIIRLTTPFQFISIGSSGTMIPSSPFVVTGTPTNTTITTWRYATDGAFSSTTTPPTGVTRSGNTVTINPLTATFKTLNISASNGSISDSITIVKVEDGGKGEGSYTVLLSNGNHTFAGTETTALAGSTETQILVYSGIERVFPTSITVNTSDLPVGMTRSISLETSRVTFNVTTAMTSASGTIPITFVVNGRSMTALFSYSISFKGSGGEGSTIIRLTGDTQFISVSKTGIVVPSSNFTVVGTAVNTSISSWRYTVNSNSPSTTPPTGVSRSGNIVTINPNTSTFKLLTIIASDGTVSDSFSIAKVTDGGDGDDGKDGDGNAHIYRHSLLKPATPTSGVANPTGWVNSPDKGISTPVPTNWTLKDKWYQSEELTTLGETSISVISFTTTLPNQVVVLELWADGYATYDYIYAGKLNIGVTTSNYYDRVIDGKKTISYDVPNVGSHTIQIMWRKGITAAGGSNRGYFAIIKNVKVWRSTTAVINKIYQSWSSPEEYYPDTSTEETIYCLSKTETPPLISDSAAYIDEYLPLPCALSSYRGDFSTSRSYAIAQVVVYSGEYYKVIKAVPSNYTGNPTNTEYFENIKGWTDNAKGATKAFPFEYRSKRKKSGGVWRAFSPSTVDGRWVENGKPGEDGDGITSTDIHYAKSQNGVTPPTIAADWGTSLPTPVKGWYLWTRTTHNYRKSAPITSYSVSYWAEDGDKGDDGKNIYLSASTQLIQFNSAGTPTPSGIVSVVGTAINTTITTWLYSVNGGTFGSALPAGVSRTGNTVSISPSTITFRTLTIHASDGVIVTTISIAALYDGSNGLPGKMPIQIEWTAGDLHLNNETVVHYIYYRAGNTWWRLKDAYSSRTASSVPSTVYYQQLSSVESFVTKILIAEQANLGGLIFKDNKLISQKGMINGVESPDFANPLFKPYVYIDGSNGEIKANKLLNPFVISDVDIPGDLQSKLTNNHNVYIEASGSGGSDWVYHSLPGSGTLADKALDGLNLKIYAPNGSNKRIRIRTAHDNGLIFTENPETTTTKIEIVPGARERIHLSAVWDRVAETLDWVITFRSSYMVKAQTTNTTENRVPNVFKPNDIIFKGRVSSSGVGTRLVSFYNNSIALGVSVTSNVFRISIPFQSFLNTSGNLIARSMSDDQFGIEIYPETTQSNMYSYSLNRYLGDVGGINGVHFYIQFRNQSNVVSAAPFYFVVKALDYIFNNNNLSDEL